MTEDNFRVVSGISSLLQVVACICMQTFAPREQCFQQGRCSCMPRYKGPVRPRRVHLSQQLLPTILGKIRCEFGKIPEQVAIHARELCEASEQVPQIKTKLAAKITPKAKRNGVSEFRHCGQ